MALTTRRDPTRTTLLRRQFIRDMNTRFRNLRAAIRKFVVGEDAFGLAERPGKSALRRAGLRILQRDFAFQTNPQKMVAFRQWLQQRIDEGVLTVDPISGKPWTSKYVGSAYHQGVMRSYIESNKQAILAEPAVFEGTRDQFLRMAFAQPEVTSKLELLGTRAFEQLRGVTATMSQQISRHLADGLSQGWAPIKIARTMNKSIEALTRTRARMIARTEIINAHAEGQLDSFELLGVDEIGVMAEWVTAGDGLVCEQCAALEGRTYKVAEARGMVPLHPNCRCAWVPTEPKKTK